MKQSFRGLAATGALALLGLGSVSQGAPPTPAAPDAPPAIASLDAPENQPSAEDAQDFKKYFLFHKEGVPLERATADFAECWSYAANAAIFAHAPKFAPIQPEIVNRPKTVYSGDGLVGTAIASIAIGAMNNKIHRVNWRKCMSFKGYTRYGISKRLWSQLNEVDMAAGVEAQARLASGPVPHLPRLQP